MHDSGNIFFRLGMFLSARSVDIRKFTLYSLSCCAIKTVAGFTRYAVKTEEKPNHTAKSQSLIRGLERHTQEPTDGLHLLQASLSGRPSPRAVATDDLLDQS